MQNIYTLFICGMIEQFCLAFVIWFGNCALFTQIYCLYHPRGLPITDVVSHGQTSLIQIKHIILILATEAIRIFVDIYFWRRTINKAYIRSTLACLLNFNNTLILILQCVKDFKSLQMYSRLYYSSEANS